MQPGRPKWKKFGELTIRRLGRFPCVSRRRQNLGGQRLFCRGRRKSFFPHLGVFLRLGICLYVPDRLYTKYNRDRKLLLRLLHFLFRFNENRGNRRLASLWQLLVKYYLLLHNLQFCRYLSCNHGNWWLILFHGHMIIHRVSRSLLAKVEYLSSLPKQS